jgi:arylsulfatase A-like enzyme/Tfp pilus assembly protein PilF
MSSRPSFIRRSFLAFLGAACALSGAGLFSLRSSSEKPNLLLVTIDTLRADHLAAYGYPAIQTPHIDELAKKGVLFPRAYSHVPLTLPSHCSLMTGTLPIYHGVRDNGYRLPASAPTLAEILKDGGYRTAAFVGAFPLDSRFGLDRGFEFYDDLYGSRNIVRDLSFVERKAEEVNEKALAWLASHRTERFFLWIHYFDPHAPYEPPSPFREQYRGREYDGEIAYTDAAVGRVLGKLEEWGLTARTLIILTADHGEALGEHRETTHGIFVYDATLHVPLIFSGPNIPSDGQSIRAQVGLTDIAPTVLELLGFHPAPQMQGSSLGPLLRKSASRPEKACYIESVAAMMDRNWAPLQGIRTERWKFIEAPQPELYDLESDPAESQNVIDKFPAQAQKMQQALQALVRADSSPAAAKALQAPMDNDTKKKLMSLGYLTGKVTPSSKDRPDPKTMISLDNLFNDAIIASESGDLEKADRLYRQVLAQQPDFIVGYEYAAYNLYKMRKLDEAVAFLTRAVASKLVTASLVSRLGLYEQEAGLLNESVRDLEKAIGLDASYTEAYNYLGVTFFKTGRTKEAAAMFQKAISLDPDYALAMNNLGNCYLELKDYETALETYKKAIATDPGLASAHNGLAVALYRQGSTDEAVQHWEKSLELDSSQPDTLYNLGRVYLRLDRKKEALRLFEAFIKIASPAKYKKDIEEVKGVIERLKKEIGRQDKG